MTDHTPLQHFFKLGDLNNRQTRLLQELVNTPISIVDQPGKQAEVSDALSCSPILHKYMDESADSQPSAIG